MQALGPLDPQEIKVTLLLAGGHQQTVYLRSDAPVLHSLLTTILARTHHGVSGFNGLYQIPLNENRAVLCFPSEHLIGLLTEPPVFVPQPEAAPQLTEILPSQCLQIDNFFTDAQHQRLLEYVQQNESDFVSTSTSTNDADYRRSMVLYSFPEFMDLTAERIQELMPDVIDKLGLPSFTVSQIESQLTLHNDGNYYKIHNDNGSPDTATRELTYVYYFYREPKAFSGGELLIYDSKVENNFYVGADSFQTVEPRNNSIVFFLSRFMHEVLPVSCPTKAFADSRFTINGWVRR
jgi:SM-20-related protein